MREHVRVLDLMLLLLRRRRRHIVAMVLLVPLLLLCPKNLFPLLDLPMSSFTYQFIHTSYIISIINFPAMTKINRYIAEILYFCNQQEQCLYSYSLHIDALIKYNGMRLTFSSSNIFNPRDNLKTKRTKPIYVLMIISINRCNANIYAIKKKKILFFF